MNIDKQKIGIILIVILPIITYFIGFYIAKDVFDEKVLELEKKQSYIALKYQHIDNEMEIVNEVMKVLEKYNLDIKEILMIKDREIDNRIRFVKVKK